MLGYLWSHRCHEPLLTPAWVKRWGKRVVTAPTLWRFVRRAQMLRRHGANLGDCCTYGAIDTEPSVKLSVGSHVAIGNVKFRGQGAVRIGHRVVLNDDVRIYTSSHAIRDPKWPTTTADVTIGDYAWIASGAMVLPGVTIGRGAVVGAGAVVARDVPPYAVASGNPASLRLDVRPQDLDYDPTRNVACFEAWLGAVR